jgi:hypothetical protein
MSTPGAATATKEWKLEKLASEPVDVEAAAVIPPLKLAGQVF